MKHVTNFPLFNGCLNDFGDMQEVANNCARLGLDGLEVIWDHDPYTEQLPPLELAVGHHMLFFANWLDFWNGNKQRLLEEFGSEHMVHDYYRADNQEELVARFKEDLQRAIDLHAEYVVFHVSEVSNAEVFTYDFHFSDEEVVDASAELINRILDGSGFTGAFLVENQWWPGLNLRDPRTTKRLLDAIAYDNKGIMLDTGHLLHTNTSLRTQAQAAAYVRAVWEAHGSMKESFRGLHLHQSLTGPYVEAHGYRLPEHIPESYAERYAQCYNHVVQIDRHEPWTDPAIGEVVRAINPAWINHELSAWPRAEHNKAVATQMAALGEA